MCVALALGVVAVPSDVKAEGYNSKYDAALKKVEKVLLEKYFDIYDGYGVLLEIPYEKRKPLTEREIKKVRDYLADFEDLSDEQTKKLIKDLENWDDLSHYQWEDENNLVLESLLYDDVLKMTLPITLDRLALKIYNSETGTPSSWAKTKVTEAIKLGVVPEKLQYDYTKPITREEFASLFVNAVFAYQKNEVDHTHDAFPAEKVTREMYLENVKVTDYSFKDTDSEDVKLAYMMGLVSGTSATAFSPNAKITREEAATMLVNYNNDILCPDGFLISKKKFFDLNKVSSWAKDSVSLAWASGEYFEGVKGNRRKDGAITFDPKGYFTREQAIVVAMNIYRTDVPIFDTVMIRGIVSYCLSALKLKWEVSKNSVTCVAFKEGERLSDNTDMLFAAWHYLSDTATKYPEVTSEQVVATFAGLHQSSSFRTKEMKECGATGINAVFDLGFAEYEMHNKNYIFQYRLKNNGNFSEQWGYYGGNKRLDITFKRIR